MGFIILFAPSLLGENQRTRSLLYGGFLGFCRFTRGKWQAER